jgi:hypothetical protein
MEILATIVAVCERHRDSVVGQWDLVRSGGRLVVRSPFNETRQLLRVGQSGDATVWDFKTNSHVAAKNGVREPGKGHFRVLLECPRPSCEYAPQMRLRPFRDLLRERLTAMDASGVKKAVVTGIDRPGVSWIVVSSEM